eukprot:4573723-Amphidinium_carterae.1
MVAHPSDLEAAANPAFHTCPASLLTVVADMISNSVVVRMLFCHCAVTGGSRSHGSCRGQRWQAQLGTSDT